MYSDHATDIALFIHRLGGGGAERAAVNLAKGLAQRGYKVDMVLFWKEGVFLSHLPSQVRVVSLDAPTNLYPYRWHRLVRFFMQRHLISLRLDFRLKLNALITKVAFYLQGKSVMYSAWLNNLALKLADYIQQNHPKVLFTILPDPNIVAIKARQFICNTINLVICEQTTPSMDLMVGPRKHIVRQMICNLYPKADVIVAISKGVAKDLHDNFGMPFEKIKVIYNPVITPEIFQKAAEPVQHPWFADKHVPIILAVGRLVKQKDFPTLIRAFSLLRQNRHCRLVILGEGEERSALEQLARQLGVEKDVSLPGFVENPFAYMSRANLFVLSSAWEGFGNVIVEALACGCPVVSTNCRSGPAEILDNGRYGRLVPVGDYEALARAMLEALDDPDTPCDKETRIKRAMEFSVDKITEKYLQVFGFK